MSDPRDIPELREFLKGHSVAGYPVVVPIFGVATIEEQITTGPFVFYKVRAKKPVPFKDFAGALRQSAEPMTIDQWEQKYAGTRGGQWKGRMFPAMAYDLRETLEKGGAVSEQDVLFRELLDKGCMDPDGKVFCYSFPSEEVELRALRRGMAVLVYDRKGGEGGAENWAGRIVQLQKKKGVVLVESFIPVPYPQAPEAIDPPSIKPGFYSEDVWTLSTIDGGMVEAFEQQRLALPPGKHDKAAPQYVLDAPMKVDYFKTFCKEHYPEEPDCLYSVLMLFILPIVVGEAIFRPLPEGRDPDEYIIEYA